MLVRSIQCVGSCLFHLFMCFSYAYKFLCVYACDIVKYVLDDY